jgi:hypothetical protein
MGILEKQYYLKVGSFEDNMASKKDKYLRIFKICVLVEEWVKG